MNRDAELEKCDTRPMAEERLDAVVIGAGLGGLACAARMAREGASVLVVERSGRPGGLTGSFQRLGFSFELSLHLMDAVGPGEPNRAVLDELGVTSALTLCPGAALRREIWPGLDLVVPQGMEPWLDQMATTFPAERGGLAALAQAGRLAHAAQQEPWRVGDNPMLSEARRRTAAQVVDGLVHDPRLRAVLDSFSSGWLGLPLDQLSALHFLVPWYSYQAFTAAYPLGGSAALVQALVDQLEAHGGKVSLGCAARRIIVDQRKAKGVELVDGRRVHARTVISSASPLSTFHDLVEPGCLEPRYRAKIEGLDASVSCVRVWLGLDGPREDVEPTSYLVCLHGKCARERIDAAQQDISVVLPSSLGPQHVPAGRDVVAITLLLPGEAWRARGAERKGEREDMVETLVQRVETALVPDLRKRAIVREVATPETFERFAAAPGGGIYGMHTRVGAAQGWRLGAGTPVDGLWLAGASVEPGAGVTSVLRSGCALGRALSSRFGARSRAKVGG